MRSSDFQREGAPRRLMIRLPRNPPQKRIGSKNPSTTDQERLKINVLTLDDKRTTEAVIDGFLLAHSAKLEPEGDGWLLRYPLARANLYCGSVEATLPIVGETRKDALMIAELVLRRHEPLVFFPRVDLL